MGEKEMREEDKKERWCREEETGEGQGWCEHCMMFL